MELWEEGEQHLDLFSRRLAAVLADFEGLGELHGGAFVGTIPLQQDIAEAVGFVALAPRPAFTKPSLAGGYVGSWRDGFDELRTAVGTAFVS